MRPLYLSALALFLAGCQNLPSAGTAPRTVASEHQALAQESCGGCHAISANELSPRSNAPPFPVIVNQEGVTRKTLSAWLLAAHNYPREMDFYLDQLKVNALVDYMLTLRDPNFKRSPD